MEEGPRRIDNNSTDNDGMRWVRLSGVIDWFNLKKWLEKVPEEKVHGG